MDTLAFRKYAADRAAVAMIDDSRFFLVKSPFGAQWDQIEDVTEAVATLSCGSELAPPGTPVPVLTHHEGEINIAVVTAGDGSVVIDVWGSFETVWTPTYFGTLAVGVDEIVGAFDCFGDPVDLFAPVEDWETSDHLDGPAELGLLLTTEAPRLHRHHYLTGLGLAGALAGYKPPSNWRSLP